MAHHPVDDSAAPTPFDTGMTVGRLLAEPVFRGRLLGGRAGLHRPVTWCLPLSETVRGSGADASPATADLAGIAVHAPAAALGGDDRGSALVEELARRGAAALLVRPAPGQGVPGDRPSAAVRAADGAGLPLVGLAPEGDYRSIGRLVAAKVLADTTHVLEYGVRVHRTLGEVFAAGSGLPALAGSMSTLAGAAVLITDSGGELLTLSPQDGTPSECAARELAAGLHREIVPDTVVPEPGGVPHAHATARDVTVEHGRKRMHAVAVPIGVAGEIYGSVAVLEPELPPDEHDLAQHRVIVEQGAPLIASEVLRQRSVTEAEERARDDFLDTLVHGRFTDAHELEARSRHYRFDTTATHAVFAVSTAAFESGRSQHLLRSVTAARGVGDRGFAMAAYVGRLLVVVCRPVPPGARTDTAAERAEIHRIGQRIHRVVSERADGEVRVAYGRGARGAGGVASGYREARTALELSRRVDVPAVCGYDRLRVFAAIEAAAAGPEGRAFAEEVLGPLRREDGQTGNLEQVVLAYIAESGNLNAAARRLGLHRNTMLYKLERASRALQADVRSSETQFTVWLAHRFTMLNESLGALEDELSPPSGGTDRVTTV